MARRKKDWDPVKATLRAARKAHFAAGGTPAMWMHPGTVIQDPKKESSRKACRRRVSTDEE
jgi:hypothetical protein